MEELLARLKIDIGIVNSTAYDERLRSLLNVAKNEIERLGIVLDLTDVSDGELLIDYARNLWQNRRGQNPENSLSKTLRCRLNNRLFGKERLVNNPEVDQNDG